MSDSVRLKIGENKRNLKTKRVEQFHFRGNKKQGKWHSK